MALSSQDVADTLNSLGIDTPEKFAAFLTPARLQIQRAGVQAMIDRAIADQAEAANSAAARVAGLTEQRDAIDAEIRRLAG